MREEAPSSPWMWIAPAVITLLIFAGLPLTDLLFHRPGDMLEVVEIARVNPSLPPPPMPRRKPAADKPPPPRLAPERPRLLIPLQASLALDVGPGNLVGDFAVDFAVGAMGMGDRLADYIFDVEEIDAPPHPVQRFNPMYPPRARLNGIGGRVEVEFVVDAGGEVRGEQVIAAEPDGVFEAAALRAIRRWVFKPGTKDGHPVAVRVRQTLNFSLEP